MLGPDSALISCKYEGKLPVKEIDYMRCRRALAWIIREKWNSDEFSLGTKYVCDEEQNFSLWRH